jgi:alpha-L-rhamnosidase
MKGWVDWITKQCGPNKLWQKGHQYGDWLGLDKEESSPPASPGATDVYLVANAFYLRSTEIVRETAKLLGHAEDAERYGILYDDTLAAFQNEYITVTGRALSDTQTACALILAFNLAKPEHRRRIVESLCANLSRHKEHLTTGFAGTPYLCHVLSENGKHENAVQLLLREEYPSWLYCVKMGATTIWERWNSIMPSGDFEASGMNSLNHYAYGSIGGWMYRKLAGLNQLEPGYKRVLIQPLPSPGINDIAAALETPYGRLSVAMNCRGGRLTLDVEIPPNTTALICLPGKDEQVAAGSGNHHFEYDTSLRLERQRYSMNTLLGAIWKHPVAAEMIQRANPEMYNNPMIQFAFGKPLSDILAMSPQMKPLFEEILTALNEGEQQ